jgi:hypothetical protein
VKELAKERERESRWIQVLFSEGNFRPVEDFWRWRKVHASLFRDLVFQGIPDSVRSRAWCALLSSIPESHSKLTTARQSAERTVPRCDEAIRADIGRIISLMAPFATTDITQSLYVVLRGYANMDHEMGYREGMGCVAALLVSYMTEDQAFWTFNAVMRGRGLHLRGYHLGDALQLSLAVWLYLL